jgi:hypothetical protein
VLLPPVSPDVPPVLTPPVFETVPPVLTPPVLVPPVAGA